MIKRIFCLILCFTAAVLLDTALSPRLLPYVIRPSVMLALVLAMSGSFSLWATGAVAALGGLAEDMLCAEAVGVSAAAFLTVACILAAVLRKNAFKKGILYLIMTGLALLSEGMIAFLYRLYGASFDILYTFFFDGLGRSFATAACALLFVALFTQLKKGRIERA